jgi:hypothetical protein
MPVKGGASSRSSDEAPVMGVERRGWAGSWHVSVNQATGRNCGIPCRRGVVRLLAYGLHEPDESRGSRPDLWGTGGEIPPAYPAFHIHALPARSQPAQKCPVPMKEVGRKGSAKLCRLF